MNYQKSPAAGAAPAGHADSNQRAVLPVMEQHPQRLDGLAFLPGRLQLRPYQLDVINQCRQKLAAGVSKICLVAPTGSGKTINAMLISVAKQRGYKPGWASYKFREKFGFMPPFVQPKPIEPSGEVQSWLRSRTIAWRHAQAKQKGAGAA